MTRRFGLAALAVALLAAACGGGERAGTPGEQTAPPDPAGVVLRLSDLPSGYVVGDDSFCGEMGVEGASEALSALVRDERPRACWLQFEAARETGGAPLVESLAVVFPDADGAARGLELGADLLAFLAGEEMEEAMPPAGLPEGAASFATDDALVAGQTGNDAYAALWRRGAVVAGILAAGLTPAADREAALGLVEVQEARLEAPEPAPSGANEDREVPLDDPALGLPVWWLGPDFAPGVGLPPIALQESFGPLGPGESPGNRVELWYGADAGTTSVSLKLWEPKAWDEFLRTELGRLVWDSPCAEAHQVDLLDGQAVVYGGHAPAETDGGCPSRPPDYWLAHADLGDVIVSVNIPNCLDCLPPPGTPLGPYNSRAGMEAVVQGLRLRPRSS